MVNRGEIVRYHFIGIKGSGMASLAQIKFDQGHSVQGSDIENFIYTEKALINKGIKVMRFNEVNFEEIDIVVVGFNFLDHFEAIEAKKSGKEIVYYDDQLSDLVDENFSIAVCGSHGKTTTTGMLSNRFDVSYLIGDGDGGYRKNNKYFVFEACEYKNHYLKYFPNVTVVLNIDLDHVDYFLDLENYISSFERFSKNTKNLLIVNGDDENCLRLINDSTITFGLKDNNNYCAKNIVSNSSGEKFDVFINQNFICKIELNRCGIFAVYNALAVYAVLDQLHVCQEEIITQIVSFEGVRRRFKETIEGEDIFIDDYAHHPTQIKLTIDAVRKKYPNHQVIAIFKPDRYSRISFFKSQIKESLSFADWSFVSGFSDLVKNDTNINFNEEILCDSDKKIYSFKDFSFWKNQLNLNNRVFLMMSSKDMSSTKDLIVKALNKIDN